MLQEFVTLRLETSIFLPCHTGAMCCQDLPTLIAATQGLWGGSPFMDGLTSARNITVPMDVMQWRTV